MTDGSTLSGIHWHSWLWRTEQEVKVALLTRGRGRPFCMKLSHSSAENV